MPILRSKNYLKYRADWLKDIILNYTREGIDKNDLLKILNARGFENGEINLQIANLKTDNEIEEI